MARLRSVSAWGILRCNPWNSVVDYFSMEGHSSSSLLRKWHTPSATFYMVSGSNPTSQLCFAGLNSQPTSRTAESATLRINFSAWRLVRVIRVSPCMYGVSARILPTRAKHSLFYSEVLLFRGEQVFSPGIQKEIRLRLDFPTKKHILLDHQVHLFLKGPQKEFRSKVEWRKGCSCASLPFLSRSISISTLVLPNDFDSG